MTSLPFCTCDLTLSLECVPHDPPNLHALGAVERGEKGGGRGEEGGGGRGEEGGGGRREGGGGRREGGGGRREEGGGGGRRGRGGGKRRMIEVVRVLYRGGGEHGICLPFKSNTAHPRQSLFQRKMSCLRWDSNPRHSALRSAGWAQILHLIVHLMNSLTINSV